jgi:hypothetical protein
MLMLLGITGVEIAAGEHAGVALLAATLAAAAGPIVFSALDRRRQRLN